MIGVDIVGLLLATMAITPRATLTQAAGPRDTIRNCYNVQLTITPDKGGAGLGHISLIYRIRNLWSRPCTLQGFPGLEMLDRNFHSLPTHLQRDNGYLIGDVPVRRIRLDQSHDAYFALEYSDNPVGSQTCPHARYMMIIPPNDNLPDVAYSYVAPCGGTIDVSPVRLRPNF